MTRVRILASAIGCLLATTMFVAPASAANYYAQCPPDVDGIDTDGDGIVDNDHVCMHVAGSDGFLKMADGKRVYSFGFSDAPFVADALTGEPITGEPPTRRNRADSTIPGETMEDRTLGANLPAPTVRLKEGQKFFMTLSIVPMLIRPDLFDDHTVHYHGFPNASAIFDGVPDNSISANQNTSMTYYYNVVTPGTFMWHCHIEAAEHMQMGMLGNLYVEPIQNMGPPITYEGRTYSKFAYNDGDGSTGYDVDYPIQIHSLDGVFHDASESVQPLPFADMFDNYAMLNGRGYPDTVLGDDDGDVLNDDDVGYNGSRQTQKLSALITATVGQRILLRMSSLSTTEFYTLRALGLPMEVVGKGAEELRGSGGISLHYKTNAVTLGGGDSADVIIDTDGVDPGTYFLYTTKLYHLSNADEDFGGAMTEIVISAATP